jgi:SAM-dependent methyltransferase
MGRTYSAAAWGEITPDFIVRQHQCRDCGFVFFDPRLAGGELFYREASREEYYASLRPEFVRAATFARRRGLRRILDVGCGDGAFLAYAQRQGLEVQGIELNQVAAERARREGYTVHSRLLQELTPALTGGPFDLITLFQVLEHVPEPVRTLTEAKRLLGPAGVIAIAVPNTDDFFRFCPWDPAQWPPHHISHWRRCDLKRLAQAAGFAVVSCGGDILYGSDLKQGWALHNRLAPLIHRRPYPGSEILPAVVSQIYRKLGLKFVMPRWGRSIYAFLQAV